MIKLNEQIEFNIFSFLSTFARSLIEIFISLYLFKNGISFHNIILFYFFVNMFAVPLSYVFVKLGEKTKYIYYDNRINCFCNCAIAVEKCN